MGYDLHIHRADDWYACDEHPITAEEWLAVVASDPELRLDPAHGPFFALWPGPCCYPNGTWFDWRQGRIFTKNPDRAITAKMLQLARQLGARVQGDDGEFYNRPEDMPGKEELDTSLARLRSPVGLRAWAGRIGCAMAVAATLFVFAVGLVTIARWVW